MKSKPLAGIRILELGAYISAPYAGSLLCALGAEVVKVEPPKGGEAFRRGLEEKSPYFVQYNVGKKSIAVNLKDPEGVALIKTLLPKFDVLLENYRPGKIASLGLGEDVCRAINPQLVYASVSGFGDGGPMRDRPAYDSMGQSMGGLYSILNDAGAPRLTGTCMADLITAISATMGILAALLGREFDPKREGTYMETSLLESVSLLTIDAMTQMGELGSIPSRESRHPQAQNFCLKTNTGESITVHLSSSQKFWESLVKGIGRLDLLEHPEYATFHQRMARHKEITRVLEDEFATRSFEELSAVLTDADVPFAPVMDLQGLLDDPQMQWLGLIGNDAGNQGLVGPPWRFGGVRPSRAQSPPRVGQHTAEIAGEVLAEAELGRLLDRGTVS